MRAVKLFDLSDDDFLYMICTCQCLIYKHSEAQRKP